MPGPRKERKERKTVSPTQRTREMTSRFFSLGEQVQGQKTGKQARAVQKALRSGIRPKTTSKADPLTKKIIRGKRERGT